MTTPSSPSSTGLPLDGVAAIVERALLADKVRIFGPGPQILDPETGQYHPGPDVVAYEGPGAHRPVGGPGIVLRLEGQPYRDDGDGRYLLYTPLGAPIPAEGQQVTIVESKDQGAVGRIFLVLDPGETGTLQVVRTTWMRVQKTSGGTP